MPKTRREKSGDVNNSENSLSGHCVGMLTAKPKRGPSVLFLFTAIGCGAVIWLSTTHFAVDLGWGALGLGVFGGSYRVANWFFRQFEPDYGRTASLVAAWIIGISTTIALIFLIIHFSRELLHGNPGDLD